MANRTGRQAVRSVRRPTFWEGVNIDVSVVSASANVITIVTEAVLEGVPNPTIVRVRGDLLLVPTALTANARLQLTMGIMVADVRAVAVPATPLPLDDIGSDWLWWSNRAFIADAAGGPPIHDGGDSVISRIEFDGKAMRKVQPNQVLILVVQNSVVNGTGTIRATGVLRMLFKK